MRQATTRRPAVLALLAVVASLGAMLTPGVASANPTAQFTMVQSSGRAGMEMNVQQVTPCPSIKSGTYQVLASFTDAGSNVVMDNYPVSTTPKTGVWDTNPATIQIPLTAAQGDGTLNLWCVRSGQTSHAMDYIAQTYNVSGPAASATASQASYATGETVHITANTPCDNVSALIHALTLVDPNETNDLGNGMAFDWSDAPNGYGTWDMSLIVPSFAHDGQGDPVSPAGDYQLIMSCTIDGRWMTFQTVYFTVTQSPLNYVALGDSFSSGEGIGSFESGTNTPGTDMCHRSSLAYPRLLEANASLNLNLGTGFVACSGSHTSDILDDNSTNNTQNNEDAQANSLGSDTDVVTLTVGGNDIGFVNFAQACVFSYLTCNFSSPAYADALDKINNDLPTALENTYRQVLTDTTTSQAQIYVMGYPQVAPDKTAADPFDERCPFFWDSGYDPTGTIALYWEDAQAARDIVGRINSHIESLIWDMRQEGGENLRLHYVEVNGPGSPFEGHEMCSTGDSFFQNLDQYPSNNAAPFHPNAEGQEAYAQLLTAAMNW